MTTRKRRLTAVRHNTLLELGKHGTVPRYIVIGDMCSFYLWRDEDGKGAASEWLTGRVANDALSTLRQLIVKDKAEFIQGFNKLYEEHKK